MKLGLYASNIAAGFCGQELLIFKLECLIGYFVIHINISLSEKGY